MTKAKSSKRKEWIRKHKPKFYRREEKPLGKNDFEEAVKVVKMEFPNSYIVIDRKDKTITVGKGYEQGKKDAEKKCPYATGIPPYFKKAKEKCIVVIGERDIIRKQTLEEVLKEFTSDRYDCPTIDPKALKWLEQKLKAMD